MAVAVEPDLGWNDEQGRRLALRADHGYTSETKTSAKRKDNKYRGKVNFNLL
jgi:hypothetical protein